jgi:hypothetical protein
MKLTQLWIAAVAGLLLVAGGDATAEDRYNPRMTSCQMAYNLKGWSLLVNSKQGVGTITCDNGQKAEVALSAIGGGLTIGKSEIVGGVGRFSQVRSVEDLFGTYAQADAHAGAARSAEASVLTRGEVSFCLAGTGAGMDLGVSFGGFTIAKH